MNKACLAQLHLHVLPGVVCTPQDADRDSVWDSSQLLLWQWAATVADKVQKHVYSTRLR
jgi:hypothetical protein